MIINNDWSIISDKGKVGKPSHYKLLSFKLSNIFAKKSTQRNNLILFNFYFKVS